MKFVISMPAGPDFDPRIRYALESLRVQNSKVNVAICDVSDDPKCRSLVKTYSDIVTYSRHGSDKGQSDAINEGWRAVDGDIYGWLNVDDVLAPNALDIVERVFIDNPGVDVIYGQSLVARGQSLIGLHNEVRPISDEIYRNNMISQPSCFVRREALFNAGLLDVDLHYTMDWDLWMRLYEMGAKFHYVPDVLSVVAWDAGTKTASLSKRRYSEIINLSHRHTGWYAARRTALSFLLEHLSQYGVAKHLYRAVLSGVRRKNDVPYRRWRAVEAESKHPPSTKDLICDVPLFHYQSDPHFRLAFVFENAREREIEICGGERITSVLTKTQVDIILPKGQSKTLRISSDGGTMSDLVSVTWE